MSTCPKMFLSSFLTICGLVLNAIGAFAMLRWPVYANAICLDSNDKKWKEAGGLNSKVVPPWKVFRARIGPWLLFLGFVPQILAFVL